MRDRGEGKTKHLGEYGEDGKGYYNISFGVADKASVEKKCTGEFVTSNLFGIRGFDLFSR